MLEYDRKEIFIMKKKRTREILDYNIEKKKKKNRWNYKLY